MRKVCITLLLLALMVSCSDKEQQGELTMNESISKAVTTLGSTATAEDLTIKLSGDITTTDLLILKEALVLLEYKSVGNGFLTIDMSEMTNVQELDPQYFGTLQMLKSVKLPVTLKEIPKYLFFQCKYLKNVTMEENTTCIGYKAFYGCERLETLTIKSNVLEIRRYAFFNVNPELKLEAEQELHVYTLQAPVFDSSSINTFDDRLPETEAISVTKEFISIEDRKGAKITVNLSIKYTSDADCLYTIISNAEVRNGSPQKIVASLKTNNAEISTAITDIDGILANVTHTDGQKITIVKPTDGSTWYSTSYPEVFYTCNTGRAHALEFKSDSPITITSSANCDYYYFKIR